MAPDSSHADVGPVTTRLAISSAVWGVIVVLAGIATLLASDSSGPDATRGQASMLRMASAFLTMTVGVLFIVGGQRLRVAAQQGGGSAWQSALLFLGLAIQAQIAVVLPAIATTAFMVLQGM